jgi:hypothetical protein
MQFGESVHGRDLPDAVRRAIDGVCGFDIELAMSAFTAPVRLSEGRQRIAAGKTQVRHCLLHMFAGIDSIDFDSVAMWARQEVVVLEADVRITRGDHAYVQLPVTVVFCLLDELVSEVQLWTYAAAVNGISRVA